MKWDTAPTTVKLAFVAQVAIQVVLTTLFLVVTSATSFGGPYQVEATGIFHILTLIVFACTVPRFRSDKRSDKNSDPDWEIAGRPTRALNMMVSWVFVFNCFTLGLYSYHIIVLHGENAFTAPRSLANAGGTYSVLILSVVAWLLAFYMLMVVWMGDVLGFSAVKPSTSSNPGLSTFGRKIKVDWLKRPLPVRIVNVTKNPDPRIFEKHTPAQEQVWASMPRVEAGKPTPRATTNPFEDPHFVVVSLD